MLSSKRILILVRSMEVCGGTQKVVAEISKQFQKKKYYVCINTLFYNKNDCYKKELENVKIRSVVTADKTNRLVKCLLLSNGRIASIFQFISFWIITVINAGKYGIIIPQDDFSATILGIIPKRHNQKTIWYLNYQLSQVIINTFKNHKDNKLSFGNVRYFIYKKAFNKINNFAVWSKYNKIVVEKNIKRKADLVYAGSDLSKYLPISQLEKSRNEGRLNILTIGILYPYRRYEDVIKTLYILNNKGLKCNLTIVGKSDYSQKYLFFLKNLTYYNQIV